MEVALLSVIKTLLLRLLVSLRLETLESPKITNALTSIL